MHGIHDPFAFRTCVFKLTHNHMARNEGLGGTTHRHVPAMCIKAFYLIHRAGYRDSAVGRADPGNPLPPNNYFPVDSGT